VDPARLIVARILEIVRVESNQDAMVCGAIYEMSKVFLETAPYEDLFQTHEVVDLELAARTVLRSWSERASESVEDSITTMTARERELRADEIQSNLSWTRKLSRIACPLAS
jgi:hypothetical protein